MQHHAQPVDLRLHHKLRPLHAVIQPANALVPGAGIVSTESIRQAEDRLRVRQLLKLFGGRRPGTLTGRIGRNPIGMFGLDGFQLVHQSVIFHVADDGRIQHMVTIQMETDFLLKLVVAGDGVHRLIIRRNDIRYSIFERAFPISNI